MIQRLFRLPDWAYENDNYPALVEAGCLALLNQRPDAALAAYSTVLGIFKDLGQDECTQLLQLALQFRDSKLALKLAQMLQAAVLPPCTPKQSKLAQTNT